MCTYLFLDYVIGEGGFYSLAEFAVGLATCLTADTLVCLLVFAIQFQINWTKVYSKYLKDYARRKQEEKARNENQGV